MADVCRVSHRCTIQYNMLVVIMIIVKATSTRIDLAARHHIADLQAELLGFEPRAPTMPSSMKRHGPAQVTVSRIGTVGWHAP